MSVLLTLKNLLDSKDKHPKAYSIYQPLANPHTDAYKDKVFKGSIVWLSGALCSPVRVFVGLLLTICAIPRKVRMIQCRPKRPDLIILGLFGGIFTAIYLFMWAAEEVVAGDLRKIHWTLG